MAIDKVISGKFYVYVAAADSAADLVGAPAAPWSLLGSGWNRKGEGIKHTIARSYEDVMVENELEPIDSRIVTVEQTIEAVFVDWSAESLAYAIHGKASAPELSTVAATTTLEGASVVNLELDSDMPKLAVMIFGPSPTIAAAGDFYLRAYWPLARIDGDWESTFMLATAAPNPIKFKKLKSATLNAQYHLQTAATV